MCSIRNTGEASFTPPEFDTNVKIGTPIVPDEIPYGSAMLVEYEVAMAALVTVKDRDAYIYFCNDRSNDVWMKIRLLTSEGKIVGESGLIKPDEYLEKVSLQVKSVGTEVVVKVMCYEPNTYHSKGSAQFSLPTISVS